jgi:hypothetical protein
MTSALRASCGLYKMLLLAYPRDFRRRFEKRDAQHVFQSAERRVGAPRPAGAARLWRFVFAQVLSAEVPLRLQNSIVVAMSLAFLFSSALFVVVLVAISHVCAGQ